MKLNKKQKRTATIASMAALLAVVLGMGGQTFAKYVTTTETKADTAVVAKWGFVLKQKGSDTLFKKSYGDATALSSTTSAIVAPGTSGSIEYHVTGLAEVDATITFTLTNYAPVFLSDGTATYYPITWKVNGEAFAIDNEAPFTAQVMKAYDYTAGTELSVDSDAGKILIEWEWKINNATSNLTYTVDEADTLLGEYANGKALPTGYTANTTLDFAFNATIEQKNTTN